MVVEDTILLSCVMNEYYIIIIIIIIIILKTFLKHLQEGVFKVQCIIN